MTALPLSAIAPTLPGLPNPVIGRERELADLVESLAYGGARLVTITGPGGVGKTLLAIATARALAEIGRHDAWFVPLEDIRDPGEVLPAIARELGFTERLPDDTLPERIADALHDRDTLIVLDNLEQVIEARVPLAQLLARSRHLSILATSRSPLRLRAEREYPLAPLPVPEPADGNTSVPENDAVALFIERARAVRPSLALDPSAFAAVVEICRQLDGLPLAIELAAAQTRVLSPQALLARMSRRLELLTDGAVDLPSRQRSLRDTIAWSYDLVPPAAQRVFRWMSVFAGGVTLEVIETVVNDGVDALAAVSTLVEHSLVWRVDGGAHGEDRYRMYATIQEFAAELLDAGGESAAVRGRHLDWALTLAEVAEPELTGPDQALWLDRLDAERDNLRVALAYAQATDLARGLRLGTALWRYWATRGYLVEGRAALDRLLDGDPGVTPVLRTNAEVRRAHLALDLGDYEAAFNGYDGALAHYVATEDAAGESDAHNGLGLVRWYQGDLAAARRHFECSIRIRHQLGNQHGEANALNNLGNVLRDMGELDAARERLAEALRLRTGLRDIGAVGYSHLNLGDLARRQGQAEVARRHFEQSLAAFEAVRDRLGIGYAQQALGLAAEMVGEHVVAARAFGVALHIRQQLGDRRGIIESIEGVASVATAAGEPSEGLRLFSAAAALRDAIGAPLPDADRRLYEGYRTAARRGTAAALIEHQTRAGEAMTVPEAARDAAEVAAAIAARHQDRGALTERELEVVRLVAAGRTNAEAADALYLSRRTIDAHLRRIYDKLGLDSRLELIHYAAERGLR